MVDEKKVIDEVSGWLKLYDDGSVDRTWTGPPQFKFMSDPVPPHHHFIDGVATIDTTVTDGLKLRTYLPEKQESDPEKLPILLHFHGGGFCISEADWFHVLRHLQAPRHASRAIVVSVYLPPRARAPPPRPLRSRLRRPPLAPLRRSRPLSASVAARGSRRSRFRTGLPHRGQLRREHSPPGGGARGLRGPDPPEDGRRDPDPSRVLPVTAEQVGAGAAGDAVPHVRHGGQALEAGTAGGGHQGSPDHVPDGGGGAAAGGAEAAAVSVLLGGAGFGERYANGVLRSHEKGKETRGAFCERRGEPLLLPEQVCCG
ncbi:probable carboxylesterase 15 [Phtheirospermum japonicum]|uniref:Probable carboxylesterase 15 n=1 Tax=Phtheirospermum japonicum TaxID=374723 RepID=A0A830C701_9LAMI|nr:probable carboxylesterase 15 [Phtheirospermum japonicum]